MMNLENFDISILPKEYVQHCLDGPQSLDDIIAIYRSPDTLQFSEVDRYYACWAFLKSVDKEWFSFQQFSVKIGVSIPALEKWLMKYFPSDYLNYSKIKVKKKEEKLNQGFNEQNIEKMLSLILKSAKRKIKTAGFSQLMIGFGILADKLRTLQSIRASNIHNSENILNNLPPEKLEQILKIIESGSEQPAAESVEYKVVEEPTKEENEGKDGESDQSDDQ